MAEDFFKDADNNTFSNDNNAFSFEVEGKGGHSKLWGITATIRVIDVCLQFYEHFERR